jgi:biopolymer transport protein ExbD
MPRSNANELEEKVPETNLLPVMNLMFLIIGALLFSMEISAMAAIPVQSPQSSTEQNDETSQAIDPNLVVRVGSDGFFIRHDGQQIGAQAGRSDSSRVPTIALVSPSPDNVEGLDFAALSRVAAEIKSQYPEATRFTLNADRNVAMRAIVATMDAMRGPLCHRLHAVNSSAGPAAKCLFPDVVVSDR